MSRDLLKALSFFVITGLIVISNTYAADRLPVFVSILPQKFFTERIGKDLVDVRVMVEPGASPATYEPKPSQMAALSETRLYLAIGVPFEAAWLGKIASTNPDMRIVHTEDGIMKVPMTTHSHDGKEEHEAGHHDLVVLDPHIWLSPPLVMTQARAILTALQETDPAHRSQYEANHRAFITELVELDGELRDIFAGKHNLQFMVFHPAWGYFAQAYGLEQVPIEIEGKEPKPAQLKSLIDYARKFHIRVIFAQPQFSSRSARQLAEEIKGQVVLVDPLAVDWAENLRAVAKRFDAALK